jgi:diguanylate cyclase (GGDEF)-like protein/PAS domain S-box-containing protein
MHLIGHSRTRKKLIGVYAIVLCLMVILSSVIFISLNRLDRYSHQEAQSHKAIRNAQSVDTAIIDMQRGVRGFLIAGIDSYLDSFVTGQEKIDTLINNGIEIDRHKVEQVLRWQAVQKLKQEWLENTAKPAISASRELNKEERERKFFNQVSLLNIDAGDLDAIDDALTLVENQLSNTNEASMLASNITLDLFNMETGQRGFLLTGKEKSLEPYVRGRASILNHLKQLRRLAVNNNINLNNMNTVEDLITEWQIKSIAIVEGVRQEFNKLTPTIEDVSLILVQSGGKKVIDDLRIMLSKIIAAEDKLLNELAHKKINVTNFAIKFSIFGTLAAILIGSIIAYTITRRILLAENHSLVLNGAIEFSPTAIVIASISGQIEYINASFTRILGFVKEDLIEKGFDITRAQDANPFNYQQITKALSDDGQWQGQLSLRGKDSSVFWSKAGISFIKDKYNKPTHVVATYENISKEVELNEKLSYQASHDSLTGLVNRFEFEKRVEAVLTATGRMNSEWAICFLDLDEFKLINDNGGHAAGDELLRDVSKLFTSIVRSGDVVARIGGDEFAILLSNCSLQSAQGVATKILNGVSEFSLHWEGKKYSIGVSIGVVPITSNNYKVSEILKHADTACYLAKESGKNKIKTYLQDDPETQKMEGEMRWINKISAAIDTDRFMLYAQSIVPLKGSGKISYELLLRMVSPSGDIISPAEFLPAAERYYMIQSIDKWVVNYSFKLLNANPEFIDSCNTISINLSGQSLVDDGLLNFIIEQLKNAKFKPSSICFEITETAAIFNINCANNFISSLRKFGCKFSLDDFGSGFSSFGYLKQLQVDYLKIDGMFVKNIHKDSVDLAMVKSINEIGKVMGMKTIAEFVENDEIKTILSNIGVDYAQGYGIAKPVPLCELINI